MARRVFHSAPNSKGGWSVKSNGRTISNHRKQSAAERAATSAGRRVRAAAVLAKRYYIGRTEPSEKSARMAPIRGRRPGDQLI